MMKMKMKNDMALFKDNHSRDLVGRKVRKITVLERMDIKNAHGSPYYRCVCDCGTEMFLCSNELNLKKGTTCCGCTRRAPYTKKPLGEAAMRHRYTQYKSGAKRRDLCFELSIDEFKVITQENCFYCGSVPQQIAVGGGNGRCNGSYIYNGIDRLDNSVGYTKENSVPCCGRCNRAKDVWNKNDFLSWIAKVYLYRCVGE
jgi:hypothetical protein